MQRMGSAETSQQLEELFDNKKKPVKNPFVPIGALITAGVLTAGLISFRQGNSHLGQMLMRARVVAQGGTVALMVGSAYYYGEHFTVNSLVSIRKSWNMEILVGP
ncbi:RING-H2 finger protein ATL48-like protein [Carex littledalei]|uniref:RING-H2 finger protein ATL48-like protein n=1 Tax=Carex littledalei TaxID=544730 RepID=A0A833QNG1_9POAL|nr:RING-H2 finger protein ATL48-like protein [Carex littledalei]